MSMTQHQTRPTRERVGVFKLGPCHFDNLFQNCSDFARQSRVQRYRVIIAVAKLQEALSVLLLGELGLFRSRR